MANDPIAPAEREEGQPELSEETRLVRDTNERRDVDEFVPDGLDDEANVSEGEEIASEEALRRVADAGAAFKTTDFPRPFGRGRP